jgi:hypothetical protein
MASWPSCHQVHKYIIFPAILPTYHETNGYFIWVATWPTYVPPVTWVIKLVWSFHTCASILHLSGHFAFLLQYQGREHCTFMAILLACHRYISVCIWPSCHEVHEYVKSQDKSNMLVWPLYRRTTGYMRTTYLTSWTFLVCGVFLA